MTSGLPDALSQYRAGVEAQIALLEQLAPVAGRQQEAMTRRDFDAFGVAGDERERLTQTLLALDASLRPVRTQVQDHRDEAATLSGYSDLMALRQRASALVAHILATDERSLHSWADADLARRAAVASLEQGETTLAAYRRVLTPALSHASLVDRRG